ncbi:MAG: transglutaminase-like domain-containing protein [Rhodocyclaceae bacterium]|nr:transglutaminase-like domain-containing protein [Rhodocyclaceae bacterium]
MKRREFLASLTALSLFAPEAWADKKQASKTPAAKPKASASKAKPAKKKQPPRRAVKKSSPGQPVTHSPDNPITEAPPPGTSASRLPPVKAEELPDEWRTYEITTTVALKPSSGSIKLWLPLPLNQDTLFQRTLSHNWTGNPNSASMRRLPDGNLEILHAEWLNISEPALQIQTTVTTADRHFDVSKRTIAPERDDILRRNLQGSQLIPNDGLAQQVGERIVGRIKDPVAQAKAIYDWVVDNTIYDPNLPGCGNGDVRRQLIEGQYGGRSADINGLFVAICRAIGIPARCVYGLRVGPSRLFRSLGLNSDDATRSQHVRAEFYIPGYSWIPVDPSDVRRAISLELLSDRDSKLQALRKVLFGVWEMNWIAFNFGTDVALPGRSGTLPFVLLPQLETPEGSRNGTDAEGFHYSIKTRQVAEG